MNSDGSNQHQITSNGFDVEPAYAPDWDRIAFARITDDVNGVEGILTVRPDGTGLRQAVPPTRGLEHPDWSPDGRWITYNLAPEFSAAQTRAASSQSTLTAPTCTSFVLLLLTGSS